MEGIPDFLRLTPEQRREAWERNPPKPMPAFADPKPQHEEDPATTALREQIEREKAAKKAASLAALKASQEGKPRLRKPPKPRMAKDGPPKRRRKAKARK